MLKILMVCNDPGSLIDLAGQLSKRDLVSVVWAESQQEARALIAKDRFDVLVVDLANGSALPFVKEVVKTDPFINCAMVSHLSKEEFHETTEGLGVFMQLPVSPGAEEAKRMLDLLESIGVLTAVDKERMRQ